MNINVKEPSQSLNGGPPQTTNKLFQKGRPFGYYRKRSCVYNSDGTFCGQVGSVNDPTVGCSSCDKINDPTRNCLGNNSCCSNERCARLMTNPNGISPYTDVSVYETVVDATGNPIVTKRQPIPHIKTITAPRSVYNNSNTYRKQKYSYSITEMIKNQKTSYREEQKKNSYRICDCIPGNVTIGCVNGCVNR